MQHTTNTVQNADPNNKKKQHIVNIKFKELNKIYLELLCLISFDFSIPKLTTLSVINCKLGKHQWLQKLPVASPYIKEATLSNSLSAKSFYELGEGFISTGIGGAILNIGVNYIHIAATNNDVNALENMGFRYFKGNGVKKDIEKAISSFEKAGQLGHDTSIMCLGDYYNDQGKLDLALKYYEKLRYRNEAAKWKAEKIRNIQYQERLQCEREKRHKMKAEKKKEKKEKKKKEAEK